MTKEEMLIEIKTLRENLPYLIEISCEKAWDIQRLLGCDFSSNMGKSGWSGYNDVDDEYIKIKKEYDKWSDANWYIKSLTYTLVNIEDWLKKLQKECGLKIHYWDYPHPSSGIRG